MQRSMQLIIQPRKDNAWAKANPEEIQQMYIMTSFHTAVEEKLEIHLMDHLYPDMLKVNTRDDIYKMVGSD